MNPITIRFDNDNPELLEMDNLVPDGSQMEAIMAAYLNKYGHEAFLLSIKEAMTIMVVKTNTELRRDALRAEFRYPAQLQFIHELEMMSFKRDEHGAWVHNDWCSNEPKYRVMIKDYGHATLQEMENGRWEVDESYSFDTLYNILDRECNPDD